MTFVCEVHNMLQAEVTFAERRCQLMVSEYQPQELHTSATRERLQKIKDYVSSCVNTALGQLAAAEIISDVYREPWSVPEGVQLEYPWPRPSQSMAELRRQFGKYSWFVGVVPTLIVCF